MTLPTSSDNNGIGRSLGDAAGRGAVLVGIAVLIGFVLLWAGFDTSSGDSSATDEAATDGATDDAGADGSTDAAADDTGADAGNDGSGGTTDGGGDTDGSADAGAGTGTGSVPTPTSTPGVAHPPNEVIVFVANGSGLGGEAGRVADRLTAANYTAEAGNASSQAIQNSKIYYRPDYGEDAKLIGEVLQAPASTIQQMPAEPEVSPDFAAQAEAAQVIVIIGTDGLITG